MTPDFLSLPLPVIHFFFWNIPRKKSSLNFQKEACQNQFTAFFTVDKKDFFTIRENIPNQINVDKD